MVAQEQNRRAEEREADAEPRGLADRPVRRDPVDLDEPERRQQGDQREHVRVRVREARPDEHVPEHAGAEEDGPVGEGRLVDVVRTGDEHRREAARHQQRDGDQAEELARARGHQRGVSARSSWRSRENASLFERSWWFSRCVRSRRSAIEMAGTLLAYSSV